MSWIFDFVSNSYLMFDYRLFERRTSILQAFDSRKFSFFIVHWAYENHFADRIIQSLRMNVSDIFMLLFGLTNGIRPCRKLCIQEVEEGLGNFFISVTVSM